MKLLLQRDTFSEDETSDTEAVIRKYFDVQVIEDHDVFMGEKLPTVFSDFRGSLLLASRLGRSFPWADALKWAPVFRDKMASKDFLFVDAKHLMEGDFAWPLFVRPTTGNKTFSGNVFTRESFEKEYRFLTDTRNGAPSTICMFAKPSILMREWRAIFISNRFSSGSQYMLNGEKVLAAEIPAEVVAFADGIAADPYFQNVFDFTIDVAETPGGLALVEVNGFQTASFYAADLNKVYSDWASVR